MTEQNQGSEKNIPFTATPGYQHFRTRGIIDQTLNQLLIKGASAGTRQELTQGQLLTASAISGELTDLIMSGFNNDEVWNQFIAKAQMCKALMEEDRELAKAKPHEPKDSE